MVITIDGPAGAGKTTVSKRLAERLAYRYVDTGALYRGVGYEAKAAGIPADDDESPKLCESKQLAALLGGEVGVESEPGKGSEFWFTARFPVEADGAPEAVSPVADLAGVRVLIVDDNRTNREILTNRLTAWGMRTAEFEDRSRRDRGLPLGRGRR